MLGALLILSGFFLTLGIIWHYPIFTDEITFKIIYSRYFLDSGKAIFLWPQCKTEFNEYFPFGFIPFRLLDSFLFQDLTNPLKIRWFGVFCLCIYLLLFLFVISFLFKDKKYWSPTKTIVIGLGLNCMGTLPFTLVLSRPESPMVIFLCVAILLPYLKYSNWVFFKNFSFLFPFSLVICFAGFLSYHPKSLFFFPVFFVLAFFVADKLKTKILLAATLLILSTSSFKFWDGQYQCPMDKHKKYDITSVGISHMGPPTSVYYKIKQYARNVFSSKDYVGDILFGFTTMQNAGLENYSFMRWGWRVWNRLIFVFIIVLVVPIIAGTYFSIRDSFFLKNVTFGIWVFWALNLSLLAHLGVTTRKAFYDNGLIMPVFFVLSLMGINFLPEKVSRTILRVFSYLIIILAFGSNLLLFGAYSKSINEWKHGGALAENYFLTSGYNQSELNLRLRKLASRCRIYIQQRPFRLVVDELSYPAFWQGREPIIAIQGLSCFNQKQMDSDPNIHLKAKNSAGFIGQCKYITKDLSPLALRDGDLCCIPAFVSN